jgi:hypothetical protein
MPQIVLFRRRWRVSTDALPVLALLLGLTHTGFFIVQVILNSILSDAEYQCNMKVQIDTVMYGLLGVVCLLLIDDAVIFFAGLVGGPFEEKRRRPVVVGMYCQFALIVVFTAFTIYGTVFASSSDTERECWSRTPCSAVQSVIPESCLGVTSIGVWARETGSVNPLTPACQQLNSLLASGRVDTCLLNYMDLAGQYGRAVFNESARTSIDGVETGPFNKGVNESAVSCRIASNVSSEYAQAADGAITTGVNLNVVSGVFNASNLLNQAAANGTIGFGVMNAFLTAFDSSVGKAESEGFDPNTAAYRSAASAAQFFPNFITNVGVLLLGQGYGIIDPTTHYLLGQDPLPENYTGLLMKAPWYQQCADTSLRGCAGIFGSTCNQWDLIMSLDDSHDEKSLFYAGLGVAWGSIGLSIIIYYLSFNSFTDYESDEAWIALVNKVGGVLGWTSILKNSVTEAGFTASEELGLLLKRVFGGIDMDLTDRLLGAYLAGERREWRRLRTVASKLETHGYSMNKQRGCLWGLCDGGGIDGYGLNELRSKAESSLGFVGDMIARSVDGQDEPATGNGAGNGAGSGKVTAADDRDGSVALLPNVDAMTPQCISQCEFPTPFDQASVVTNENSSKLGQSIEVAYSFVRLDSSAASLVPSGTRKSMTARRRKGDIESSLSGGIKDDTKVRVACRGSSAPRTPPITRKFFPSDAHLTIHTRAFDRSPVGNQAYGADGPV